MLQNADGLSKYLMGWIGSVARAMKKDSIAVRSDGTTASSVLVKIAVGTGLLVTVLGDTDAVPENALLLGNETRDNYEAVRFGNRRGGADADALPLANVHESEISSLAEFFTIEKSKVAEPLATIKADSVEAAMSLVSTLYGQTKGEMFMHLAETLKKHAIGSDEFYTTLMAIGQNEVATRFRHNPNIPVAHVREPGMGFVA